MTERILGSHGMRAAAATAVAVALLFGTLDATASEPAVVHSMTDADLEWGPCPEFFPAGCQIAVLHGDAAQANADVFFRVPGNYDLPAHWHTSAERMVLVSGQLDVSYRGEPTVSLKPGMYAYGPERKVHTGRCASDEPCVLFIAFESPVDATAVAMPAP